MVDHLPRPTWVVVVRLGSQPLSGSSVFKTRISDAVAGGPQRDDTFQLGFPFARRNLSSRIFFTSL